MSEALEHSLIKMPLSSEIFVDFDSLWLATSEMNYLWREHLKKTLING